MCLLFLRADEVGIDGDNPDHIRWLYDKSVERANSYGIAGVTLRLTQGELNYGGKIGISAYAIDTPTFERS